MLHAHHFTDKIYAVSQLWPHVPTAHVHFDTSSPSLGRRRYRSGRLTSARLVVRATQTAPWAEGEGEGRRPRPHVRQGRRAAVVAAVAGATRSTKRVSAVARRRTSIACSRTQGRRLQHRTPTSGPGPHLAPRDPPPLHQTGGAERPGSAPTARTTATV